jgi:hypothetical protein
MARSASGAEISQSFLNMAKAYRSQADVLKAKQKFGKKAALTNSGLFSMASGLVRPVPRSGSAVALVGLD